MLSFTLERITPQMAQYYLGLSNGNRKLRPKAIDNYAEMMLMGNFRTHCGATNVVFDEDGYLIDSHHRLSAVVKSGTTVEMYVIRGVPRDDRYVLDTGLKRTPGDILGFHNITDRNNVAAATRIIYLIRKGGSYKMLREGNAITPEKILETVHREPDIITSSQYTRLLRKQGLPTALTNSHAAALHYLFAEKDVNAAKDFFDALGTGASLVKGSPILALRNQLNAESAASQKRRKEEVLAWTIMAWNKFRAHDVNVKLIRLTDQFPVIGN